MTSLEARRQEALRILVSSVLECEEDHIHMVKVYPTHVNIILQDMSKKKIKNDGEFNTVEEADEEALEIFLSDFNQSLLTPPSTAEAEAKLTAVNGIGPATAKKLIEAGITTIVELAQADPAKLAELTASSPDIVSDWQAQAANIVIGK